MSEPQDTEIVLGTGRLLAIFFGLTAICGIFFGLGYSLGRSSGPMTLRNGPATLMSGPGAKPGAGVTLTTPAVMADATAPSDTTATSDLQKSQEPPQAQATAPSSDQRAADDGSSTPGVQPVAAQTSPTETTARNTATPELETGSITVQVAAVTKPEDAQALVSALRKKNYPVFVSPNATTDNLFHVQVGPFAELKDAEAMKSKLAGDGYNAIVKK